MLFRVLAVKSQCSPGDTIVLKELVSGGLVQQTFVNMKTAYKMGARNPNATNLVYKITSKGRMALRLLDMCPNFSHRELLGISATKYAKNLIGASKVLLKVHEETNFDGLSIKEIVNLFDSQRERMLTLLESMVDLGLVLKVGADDALRIKSDFKAKCFYKLSEKGVCFAKDLATFSIPPLTI